MKENCFLIRCSSCEINRETIAKKGKMKKSCRSIQHFGCRCCLLLKMYAILNILKDTIKTIVHLFGPSAKKEQNTDMDAIRFPNIGDKEVVEDHEMAAYHNQA